MNYLTQISRISQKPHCFARGCRHAECFHPEAHTSDSDVCFCEIREIRVKQKFFRENVINHIVL